MVLTLALLSVSIIREVLTSMLEEVFFRPVAFGHLYGIPRREWGTTLGQIQVKVPEVV